MWRQYLCGLLALAAALNTIQSAEGTCFGSSCTGWSCHCVSNTEDANAKIVCPSSSAGRLKCPSSAPHCEKRADRYRNWEWKGPGCQIGNVAESKRATMSSNGGYYNSQKHCLDGKISGSQYCETREQINPWIIVDLGSKHVVQAVDLYYSTRSSSTSCYNSQRRLKWRLLQSRVGNGNDVHNPLCTNFTDVGYGCGNHVLKRCDESLIGRYVSVQMMGRERLKLTEIAVIGFKYMDPTQCTYPGSFGCMAEAQCNLKVPNRVDYLTGYCHNGCNANYIGKYCDKEFKTRSVPSVVPQLHSAVVTVSYPYVADTIDSGKGRIRVGYRVLYRKVGDEDWIVAGTDPPPKPGDNQYVLTSLRNKVVTGLAENTVYEFVLALRKIEANLNSTLYGRTKQIHMLCYEPLVGPDIIKGVQRDAAEQTFSIFVNYYWLSDEQTRCNGPGTIYRIFKLTKNKWQNIGQGSLIKNVKPYTKVRVKVGVQNKGNRGFVFGKIREFLTGSAVVNLTAKNISSSSVNVTWTTPEQLRHLRFNFTGLYVLRRPLACPVSYQSEQGILFSPFPTKLHELRLIGLKSHAEYDVTISPIPLDGSMQRGSATFNFTTMQSAPTAKPTAPSVSPHRVSTTHITNTTWCRVNFFHIPCQSRNGNFTGFRYKLYEKNSDALVWEEVVMESERVYIKDLKPFTDYSLSYTWTNEAGESPQSDATDFKTDETKLLEVQMKINPVDRNEDNLDFTADFTFEESRGIVLKYAVECGETTGDGVEPIRPTNSDWDIDASPENLPFKVYNLKPATWYGCLATALSKKGWGPTTAYVYILTASR
ncbi:uncharacterized protein LOC141907144 [Tubulanus polymorphus]|uniref:uncharacterized protein LOC141907144 n=1 Tax=Tubulanus polymorphus TaxID=672921 RepID=UPI003DA30E6B